MSISLCYDLSDYILANAKSLGILTLARTRMSLWSDV